MAASIAPATAYTATVPARTAALSASSRSRGGATLRRSIRFRAVQTSAAKNSAVKRRSSGAVGDRGGSTGAVANQKSARAATSASDDRSRGDDDGAAIARSTAHVDEGAGAEQDRDGADRQDGGARPAAPVPFRRREIGRGHFPHHQQLAAARGNGEGVRRICRGHADARAQGDRHERGRQHERVRRAGRQAYFAEQLLDDNGAQPRRRRALTLEDRLDTNQARPERPGPDEQRGRTVDAFPGNVRNTARPRNRPAGLSIVDGDAGATPGLVGQRRGQRVEEISGGRGVARSRPESDRERPTPPSRRAQRVGTGIKALPELVLDARDRFLICRAESRAFERASGRANEQGDRHAGAGEAQKDLLRVGHATGWWHEMAGTRAPCATCSHRIHG